MSDQLCPMCGAEGRIRANRYPHSYYQCSQCKMAWLWPVPSDRELREFYSRFHTDGAPFGYAEFRSRAAVDFTAKLSLIKRFVGAGKSLLDVGCGTGAFLEVAATAGFEVRGVDVSDTAVAYAKGTLELDVRRGMLEEQQDWSNMFDVVVLLATIEHLPDPVHTLTHINRCLRTGGILLLDTGLAGDLCDLAAPGTTQWYDSPQHLWVFSRKGLQQILRETGFAIVHCDICFERSLLRGFIRKTRNLLASLAGAVFWLSVLGPRSYKGLRLDAKLPYGNLILMVARKI